MRLLNTKTLHFQDFLDANRPRYDILSHRWEGDETTLRAFEAERHLPPDQCRPGTLKIRKYCEMVANKGFEWCWVDTCCIDKTSSAELSEAINSMYRWYKEADCCTVYLNDVETLPAPESTEKIQIEETQLYDLLKHSAWFTRGWTLQELVAPLKLRLYDRQWRFLGTRGTSRRLLIDSNSEKLSRVLSRISGVPVSCLGSPLGASSASVAARMAWLAQRTTSRAEDMAYCMLGLFEVNMPLLYGEGGERAFVRLQLEILKVSYDETIFAWTAKDRLVSGILARCPGDFASFATAADTEDNDGEGRAFVEPADIIRRPPYAMTNRGLQFYPNRTLASGSLHLWIALDCKFKDGQLAAICVTKVRDKWVRVHCNRIIPSSDVSSFEYHLKQVRKKGHEKKGMVDVEPIYIEQFNVPVVGNVALSKCKNMRYDGHDNSQTLTMDQWPANYCLMR